MRTLVSRPLFWSLAALTAAGNLLILRCLASVRGTVVDWLVFTVIGLVYLFSSHLSTDLPSGAKWRPAIAVLMVCMFLLPPGMTTLVAIAGLTATNATQRERWYQYFITYAHVALGLFVGAVTFRYMLHSLPASFFFTVLAVVSGFLAHLIVNRGVSIVIVAVKQHRSLARQAKLVWNELHAGYLTSYLVSCITVLLCMTHLWTGLALGIALQFAVYQSVSHYSHMVAWHQAALTDGLTKLNNRIAWEAFADTDASQYGHGSLAVIDVDDFKQINDQYGHVVGDRVLRLLASTLRQTLPSAVELYRYGGDEFVAFYPHSREESNLARNRLLRSVYEISTSLLEEGLAVEASIGIAIYPDDASSLRALFDVADKRMYEMKSMHKHMPGLPEADPVSSRGKPHPQPSNSPQPADEPAPTGEPSAL